MTLKRRRRILISLVIFLVVIALRFILALLPLHLVALLRRQVLGELDYRACALLLARVFFLVTLMLRVLTLISRAVQVRMMQLKDLTLISTLLIIIWSFIHVPGRLFLSKWCLGCLLASIHRSGVTNVFFSRLRLDYFELNLIMANRTTLSW